MRKGSKKVELLPGEKFGQLTVTAYSHVLNRRSFWKCICECGKEITIKRKLLQESSFPTCGCVPKVNAHYNPRSQTESKAYKWNCVKNLSHWESECLIWDGLIQNNTTPKMSYLNRVVAVRRWIFDYFNPENILPVYLQCGNYKCINIKHIGTTKCKI